MNIEQHRHGAVLVIRPDGPLVEDGVPEFILKMTDSVRKHAGRVVVDASTMPYIDSDGLTAIVEAGETIAQSGRSLKLCGAQDTVREVLELTDVSHLFEHFEDVTTAVRSFL
jgi:anti-sigma B factor antagonist